MLIDGVEYVIRGCEMKLLTCAEIAKELGVNTKSVANFINFSTDIAPTKYDGSNDGVPLYDVNKKKRIISGYLKKTELAKSCRRIIIES